MSSLAGRLARAAAFNAVPLAGTFAAGWSPATVLTLYWCETALAAGLVAVRIALHRRLTGMRGHWRPQLGATFSTGSGAAARRRDFGSFFAEFVAGSLVLSAAHGLFLWLVVNGLLAQPADRAELGWGLAAVAVVQLAAFGRDLIGLRRRPFAWVRDQASEVLGRVVLVHLAILGGMVWLASRGGGPAFFAPFVALKALADLGAALPVRGEQRVADEAPRPPPGWTVKLMNRLKPGDDFAAYWQEQQEELRRDEEVLAGRPVGGPRRGEGGRRQERRERRRR